MTLLANNASFSLGLGLGMWILRVSPWAVSWTFEGEQTWPLSECVAELLEFVCVESEGSAVPLVRLTIPWAADRVQSDFEYFARLSSVGCMGTVLVSVVWGEQDYHRVCCVWLERLMVRVAACLADQYRGGNHELLRFTDSPTLKTFVCFKHSTCG